MGEVANVTINGREVQTEKGRLLIDVAEEMGIFVPRFCYHPGMKSVAVCRMCLVKVEGQNKLLPACATPVADGMNVNTVDEEAVDAQEGMLEFLLINHPLDCPICDRAGECPLQDQTYAHGPGSSRYVEPKRTYEKALEISELVVLDRERCVLCWRCVRFCEEIAGDQFIQLVDRGAGTQILTFSDEPFDSYFSGNTVQICPVGALLSRPYRFVSRPWDLDTSPSVCSYCAVGCPISNEERSDKLVRCQAMPNENVNDFWVCDKGRYGFHYVNSEDRLETPLVRNAAGEFEPAGWGPAVQKVAGAVKDKRVGVIAGGHLTTEDAYAIARLARKELKTKDVDSRLQDDGAPYELALRLHGAAGSSAEMRDLEAARSIVWIGPDPKETLPVLYLRLRKAVRECNVKLTVIGPRRISLDDFATHSVRTDPGRAADAVRTITGDPEAATDLGGPMVVCWGPSSPGVDESETFLAATDLALAKEAKLLVCPPHAGSQGMIDMGVHPGLEPGYKVVKEPGRSTREMLEAAAAGELDALLVFGADLVTDFPDGALARKALETVGFSAVVELFPTETALLADVVLPSTAYAEREGTLVNLERRIQKLEPLLAARGSSLEPWRICARIAAALGSDWKLAGFDDVWKEIRKASKPHKNVDVSDLTKPLEAPAPQAESPWTTDPSRGAAMTHGPGGRYPKGHRAGAPFHTGQNWPLSWELRAFEAKQRPGIVPEPADKPGIKEKPEYLRRRESVGFRLYTGRMIYDAGAMVSRTRALRSLAKTPFVEMNDRDVKELGLADGDEVVVSGNGAELTLPLRIGDVAQGAVFLPFDQPGARANALIGGRDPYVQVRAR
ncbi:MAG TPA: NADH-quinone oxidoreductase subunit NuoG [Actinomycetota bacterium]|nr:NADH-quinone oxidoreductase subunit NuoG [Actinomycetota bacterium]